MTQAPFRRLAALAAVVAIAAAACSGGSSVAPILPSGVPTQAPTDAPSTAPTDGGTGQAADWMPDGCPAGAPTPLPADSTATVTLATEKGDIVIEVKGSLGPLAAANFLALVECGAYDGVIFHRIMPGFMVQAGDVQYGRQPNVDEALVGTGGPGYTITDDPVTTPYGRGTVAMARTPQPNSAGSQFFIVVADTPLDPTYAIFGTVLSGMEVADTISTGPSTGGQESRALEPVAITKATVTRP
jgi:peptidyl-prolyl cis-trans isomerase B (cyclophilin B)